MFADNTNLFFNSSSYKALYEVTNTQLKHVEAWLSANKLTLNTVEPLLTKLIRSGSRFVSRKFRK